MAVTSDIVATYKGPRPVLARLQSMGPREDRLLAFLMGACILMFFGRLPGLARQAHLEGSDQSMLMGAALMGTIFILPLLLYALALIVHWVLHAVTGQGEGHLSRLALFWALLAASPLALLHGLIAGFIGPGPEQQGVGLIWFALFMWFWVSGLALFYRRAAA